MDQTPTAAPARPASALDCQSELTRQRFALLTQEVHALRARVSPTTATALGDHRRDHLLDDFSDESQQDAAAQLGALVRELEALEPLELSLDERVDREMAILRLKRDLMGITELRTYQTDPMVYSAIIGNGLFNLLSREFAPLELRMESAIARIRQIPRLLKQARENLRHPPRVHTETSIQQIVGTQHLIRNDVGRAMSCVPALESDFQRAEAQAQQALLDYQRWLEQELWPVATDDFRLGPDRWRRKVALTLDSSYSPEEILESAELMLERVRRELYDRSRPLYEAHHPGTHLSTVPTGTTEREVITFALELANREHPTPEGLLDEVRMTLARAMEFARESNLVSLPDEPLDVIEVPEYMRGVAVAYCASPGPLERHLKTHYMVSPPPASWNSHQVESYLREYNRWMLYNLSVHEAIPGHYVQLAAANRHTSLLRAMVASGTFIEGWAVYTEQLMADAGFTGNPLLKLMQLKMALRAATNAVLDQRTHCHGLSEAEAMSLMTEGAFQEEREAAGKWRRCQLTSCQLSTYFVGLQEVLDLRREYEVWRADRGLPTDPKTIHDALLEHGSPSPRHLRTLLMSAPLD